MADILVTDVGLQAITNAEAGGFLLDLESYKLTQTLPNIGVGDTALVGAPVNTGFFELIEAVSTSTVRFTIFIPTGLPATGQWNLKEIGLYLRTGELFAHGKLNHLKTGSFGLRIRIYVTAARLGEVINITLGRGSSGLPSAARVRDLIPPKNSPSNAIVVLDQFSNGDEDNNVEYTPSIAIKSGAGESSWAFLGYTREYMGFPASAANTSTFVLDASKAGGFWLNDTEEVLVQVVYGPGMGESRKVRYTKSTNTFSVLEKPFSALSVASKIAIWRNTANQLPEREKTIPEAYVLGIGLNTFDKTVTVATGGILVPHRYDFSPSGTLSDNLGSSGLPAGIFDNAANVTIYVNGKERRFATYYFTDMVITWIDVAPLITDDISIVAFEFVTTSQGFLDISEATYDGDGVQTDFNLPIVPDEEEHVLAFVNNKLISLSEFTLTGASVHISQPPNGEVTFLAFGNILTENTYSEWSKNVYTSTLYQQDFIPSAEVYDVRYTIITLNGEYLNRSQYYLVGQKIRLFDPLPAGVIVNIWVVSSFAIDTTATVEGENTGPVWVDPAGVKYQPNRLVPYKFFVDNTNGPSVLDIPVIAIPDENHSLVFVNGVYQDPESYTYNPTTVVIRLSDTLIIGAKIEIVCFASEKSSGTVSTTFLGTFNTEPQGTAVKQAYTVPGIHNAEGILVFLSGIYQDSSNYTLSTDTITFIGLTVAYVPVTIWIFNVTTAPRKFNAMLAYRSNVTVGVSSYTVIKGVTDFLIRDPTNASISETNVLAFIGSVHQPNSQYNLVRGQDDDILVFTPDPAATPTLVGVIVSTRSLISGYATTRLVLRDEWITLKSEVVLIDNIGKVALLPEGSTAQRPAVPKTGSIRVNSDLDTVEVFIRGAWYNLTPP
jgi:hypothetical protein